MSPLAGGPRRLSPEGRKAHGLGARAGGRLLCLEQREPEDRTEAGLDRPRGALTEEAGLSRFLFGMEDGQLFFFLNNFMEIEFIFIPFADLKCTVRWLSVNSQVSTTIINCQL